MIYSTLLRLATIFLIGLVHVSFGFVITTPQSNSLLCLAAKDSTSANPDEIIARRIIVTGDVQGGYYRACVRNEAGRFRRLVGNMTPPDENSKEAEIYVEGKRRMVDGFVRWCQKSNVGLSQIVKLKEVREEEPTGLYEDFYVQS